MIGNSTNDEPSVRAKQRRGFQYSLRSRMLLTLIFSNGIWEAAGGLAANRLNPLRIPFK
jgi:hypothetical protein